MFQTYGHYTESGRLFYIGKGLPGREKEKSNRNKHWQNTVDKYGLKVEIFAKWNTEAEAFDHERFLITCFRDDLGFKLCNQTNGGDGWTGGRHTEASKASMSAKLKGRVAPNKGMTSPLKGKTLSDEHKRKLSAAKLGKVSMRKGCILSAETRLKISKVQIGTTWLNNGLVQTKQPADRLNEYFAKGYILGRLSSKRSNISN